MKEIQTLEQLNDVTQSGTVLLIFGAKWCGHCVTFKSIAEKASIQYEGKFETIYIDVDAAHDVSDSFDIMAIPTLVLYKDGKRVGTKEGGLSEKDLIAFLGIL